jgi:RNA polymerase sigma-70 factor (ECF subfamily)
MSMTATERAARTEGVWREFQARLHAFVARRVKAPEDAEDIVQDVFVRIHRNLDNVQKRDSLPAWIFQITRNAIADHYRGGPKAEGLDGDLEPQLPPDDDDIELRELSELSGCIEPMIEALPQQYRDALKLTDLNGMGQREAAELKGISVSGMKSRVQRARNQLKEMILRCCQIELDRRGGIMTYSARPSSTSPCATQGGEPPAASKCRAPCK